MWDMVFNRPFTGAFWGFEAIHSILVAVICFIIFLKTREAQKLSSHKGVKYFRMTFLFFGIASLLKLLTRHLAISFFFYPDLLDIPSWILALGAFGIIYTYTMAAFYLLYSTSWNKITSGLLGNLRNLHLIALSIALLVLLTNASVLYIIFQIFLVAYSIGVIHTIAKSSKKANMLVVYELLLIFWMLNLLDTTLAISGFWQILVYLFSSLIFFTILYKVTKNLKVSKS